MTINNQPTVQVETVVVSVVHVDGVHTLFELAIRDDFADVFKNELARFEYVTTPNAPALFGRHETFETLCPAVPLDSLIHALVPHGAHLTAAFRVHHSVEAVIATTTNVNLFLCKLKQEKFNNANKVNESTFNELYLWRQEVEGCSYRARRHLCKAV